MFILIFMNNSETYIKVSRSRNLFFYLLACLVFLLSSISPVYTDDIIGLEEVAKGLVNPTGIASADDGTDRLFVTEKRGVVMVVDLNDNKLTETPFLDIQSRVFSNDSDAGLVAIAFHPDFENNQRFFVNYNTNINNNFKIVVAEYHASSDNPNIAEDEERIIMEISMATDMHHGGQLKFGPDGFLYISVGDGGPARDPLNNAQNKDTLPGTILRVDVDGELPLSIPPDNPFVGKEGADEIWAYGFRNPWRFSFDRLTGRLFVGDVGALSFEEIDIVEVGGNYGWNKMEGTHCFPPVVESCDQSGLNLPIVDYSHKEGRAVIGGYVYRGSRIPELFGLYIYGDNISSKIWSLEETSPNIWERHELIQTDLGISSFSEDEEGELYIADHIGGTIHKIIRRSISATPTPVTSTTPSPVSSPTMPPKLFEIDCEENISKGAAGLKKLILELGESETCVLRLINPEPGTFLEVLINHVTGFRESIKINPLNGFTNSNDEFEFVISAKTKGIDWVAWTTRNNRGEFSFTSKSYRNGSAGGMFVEVR